MRSAHLMVGLFVALGLVLVPGCGKKEKDEAKVEKPKNEKPESESESESEAKPESESDPEAAAKPKPKPKPKADELEAEYKGAAFGTLPKYLKPAAAAENAVYFWVRNVGAVRLDDSGFKKVDGTKKDYCTTMFTSPVDGAAHFVGWGVHKLTAAGKETVASKALTGKTIHDVAALGPNGAIVAAKFRNVWHNDGSKWTKYAHTDIGFEKGGIKGAYIDADGTVFLSTTYAFHVLDGGTWKPILSGATQEKKIFVNDFDVTEDGILFTLNGKMGKYDGKTMTRHKIDGFTFKASLIAPDGMVYVVSHDTITGHDAKDLSAQKAFSVKESSTGNRIIKASMDSQGRLWVATDNGVAILDDKMKPKHWKPGTIPEIAGQIQAVLAVGAGPKVVPEAGKVAEGNLKGLLYLEGAPAPNAKVEICDLPRMSFKTSPCEDKPFTRSTTTNDKGEFTFEKVPLNAYGVAALVGGKWSKTMGSSCSGIQEGQTCDLGKLNIKRRSK